MGYFSQLITRAFRDTWDLVFDRSFLSAVIAIGIFFGTFWLLRCRKQHEEAKRALRDFGVAALITACAFLAVFLLNVLLLTPAALYGEEHAAKNAAENALKKAPPAPIPPFQITETDTQARKQIEDLQRQLAETKEALRNTIQVGPSDPFAVPIAAVKFTISLNLKDRKNSGGHEISDGLLLILVAGEKGLLHGTTTEHFEDNSGQRRYFVDIPFDSGQMGEAISTLSDATSIIVQFRELLMPLGTVISDGQIVMLVNNQITVKFDVPGQTIEAKANDHPVIIVRDIQKQMQQVIKPPSSTPSMATSQPSPAS